MTFIPNVSINLFKNALHHLKGISTTDQIMHIKFYFFGKGKIRHGNEQPVCMVSKGDSMFHLEHIDFLLENKKSSNKKAKRHESIGKGNIGNA